MAVTPNFSWDLPVVGGSNGTWGTTLNTDLNAIDEDLFAVSEVADEALADAAAAQATADQALEGGQTIIPTAITLTGGDPYAAAIDLAVGGPVYVITQTSPFSSTECHVTFSNRPAVNGKIIYLHFNITGTGGFDVDVTASQRGWALPLNIDSPASSIGTLSGTGQLVIPLYIVAGV